MSTLTPVLTDPQQPPSPDQSTEDSSVVPKWAYGVIAGGSAAVATAGFVAYHAISKNRRQKLAEEEAKTFNQQQDQIKVTPREVVSRYSPRPGEKIL